MEKIFLEKVYEVIGLKVKSLDKKFIRYISRAISAGVILTITYAFTTQLSQDFISTNSPLGVAMGKTLSAYFFGIGLIFILFSGSELFTSNVMYFSIGFYHKKVTIVKSIQILFVCWIFNLLGAAITSFALVKTGLFSPLSDGSFPNNYLLELAAKKASLEPSYIFFRAILANLIVTLVVYIATVSNESTAKFFIIPFGLMPFVYLGFEHSIANFGVFLLTILAPGGFEASSYGGIALTYGGIIKNLFFSTAGNIVGGGLLTAGYLAYLHKPKNK